jgi:glucose dehydrogenase
VLRSLLRWDITVRMKNSKFWLVGTLLQVVCVWALAIVWPGLAVAQTSGTSSGAASSDWSRASLADTGWASYGHDAGGTRYSAAMQINRDNVGQLKVAWTYRTGALDGIDDDLKRNAAFEATPILVDGRLYLSTPFDHVIALEP